jgi:hypothetical protein
MAEKRGKLEFTMVNGKTHTKTLLPHEDADQLLAGLGAEEWIEVDSAIRIRADKIVSVRLSVIEGSFPSLERRE